MRLSKHHGLGNDFLVLTDRDGALPITAVLAREVCDRHRGVGADGLLRLSPGTDGADVTMELRNADGSPAEMSGNGISCLAQAAVLAGIAGGPTVTVTTAAGRRTVQVAATGDARTHHMTVAMGRAEQQGEEPAWVGGAVLAARRVDTGNPHLVLRVADVAALHGLAVDLEALGEKANAEAPHGTNLELVAPGPGPGELTMVVYERGVGPTQACGTGASATAAAAVAWGIAPAEAVVHQPGGPASVRVEGDEVHLTVPVVHVADVEWYEERH